MKIACSSQSFDEALLSGTMSLEEFYQFCAPHKCFQGVELEDKHIVRPRDDDYLASIRSQSRVHALPIVNLAFDCNFGYESSENLHAELLKVEAWVKVAVKLEIPRFRLFAGWPEGDKTERWPTMIQTYQRACRVVRSAGLTVVTENHNHGGFLSSSDDVLTLFQDALPETPQLLLDTGNYTDGLSGVLRTAHHAGHVHAKVKRVNADGSADGIDYPAIIQHLKQIGYQGYLSVEYEGEQSAADAVPKFATYLQSLIERTGN